VLAIGSDAAAREQKPVGDELLNRGFGPLNAEVELTPAFGANGAIQGQAFAADTARQQRRGHETTLP